MPGQIIGGIYVEDPENKIYHIEEWICGCGSSRLASILKCHTCGQSLDNVSKLTGKYLQTDDSNAIWLVENSNLVYSPSCANVFWQHNVDTHEEVMSCASCGETTFQLASAYEGDRTVRIHQEPPLKKKSGSSKRGVGDASPSRESSSAGIAPNSGSYRASSYEWREPSSRFGEFDWFRSLMILVAVIAVAGLVWGIIWYAKKKAERHPIDGKLTGVYWSREVPIQKHKMTNSGRGTISTDVPEGATVTGSRSETKPARVKTGRQIPDKSQPTDCPKTDTGKAATVTTGTKCYKMVDEYETRNVTFTYQDWELWEWVRDRNPSAADYDHTPYWPQHRIGNNERYEYHSLEASPQVYKIFFEDVNGVARELETSFDRWRVLNLNASYVLLLDGFGDLADYYEKPDLTNIK